MPANQQLFDSDASSLSDLSDSSASSASPPKKPAARKTKAAAKGKRGATHNSKPSIGASSETAGKGKKNAGKGRGAAASSTKPGPKTKTTKAKSKASGGALHTDGQLYCICRTEYDGKQFMIACDRCMEWYHGKCVGIKPASAKKKKTFICAECEVPAPEESDSMELHSTPLVGKTPGKTTGKGRKGIPGKSQKSVLAMGAAGAALSEDDICVLCDGECTCNGAPAVVEAPTVSATLPPAVACKVPSKSTPAAAVIPTPPATASKAKGGKGREHLPEDPPKTVAKAKGKAKGKATAKAKPVKKNSLRKGVLSPEIASVVVASIPQMPVGEARMNSMLDFDENIFSSDEEGDRTVFARRESTQSDADSEQLASGNFGDMLGDGDDSDGEGGDAGSEQHIPWGSDQRLLGWSDSDDEDEEESEHDVEESSGSTSSFESSGSDEDSDDEETEQPQTVSDPPGGALNEMEPDGMFVDDLVATRFSSLTAMDESATDVPVKTESAIPLLEDEVMMLDDPMDLVLDTVTDLDLSKLLNDFNLDLDSLNDLSVLTTTDMFTGDVLPPELDFFGDATIIKTEGNAIQGMDMVSDISQIKHEATAADLLNVQQLPAPSAPSTSTVTTPVTVVPPPLPSQPEDPNAPKTISFDFKRDDVNANGEIVTTTKTMVFSYPPDDKGGPVKTGGGKVKRKPTMTMKRPATVSRTASISDAGTATATNDASSSSKPLTAVKKPAGKVALAPAVQATPAASPSTAAPIASLPSSAALSAAIWSAMTNSNRSASITPSFASTSASISQPTYTQSHTSTAVPASSSIAPSSLTTATSIPRPLSVANSSTSVTSTSLPGTSKGPTLGLSGAALPSSSATKPLSKADLQKLMESVALSAKMKAAQAALAAASATASKPSATSGTTPSSTSIPYTTSASLAAATNSILQGGLFSRGFAGAAAAAASNPQASSTAAAAAINQNKPATRTSTSTPTASSASMSRPSTPVTQPLSTTGPLTMPSLLPFDFPKTVEELTRIFSSPNVAAAAAAYAASVANSLAAAGNSTAAAGKYTAPTPAASHLTRLLAPSPLSSSASSTPSQTPLASKPAMGMNASTYNGVTGSIGVPSPSSLTEAVLGLHKFNYSPTISPKPAAPTPNSSFQSQTPTTNSSTPSNPRPAATPNGLPTGLSGSQKSSPAPLNFSSSASFSSTAAFAALVQQALANPAGLQVQQPRKQEHVAPPAAVASSSSVTPMVIDAVQPAAVQAGNMATTGPAPIPTAAPKIAIPAPVPVRSQRSQRKMSAESMSLDDILDIDQFMNDPDATTPTNGSGSPGASSGSSTDAASTAPAPDPDRWRKIPITAFRRRTERRFAIEGAIKESAKATFNQTLGTGMAVVDAGGSGAELDMATDHMDPCGGPSQAPRHGHGNRSSLRRRRQSVNVEGLSGAGQTMGVPKKSSKRRKKK